MALWWSISDVQDRARDLDVHLGDEEARDILYRVKRHYDANCGVTWETFDTYIIDIKHEHDKAGDAVVITEET
jgi:hypothetical protein